MQHRKTWSEEDSAQLRTHYIEKGRSPAMAAVHFKCSVRAVYKRAAELGLKFLTARERREQLIGSRRFEYHASQRARPTLQPEE